MESRITILDMAQSLARHSAVRQNLITENIANADTPRYRARDVQPFAEIYQAPGGDAPRGAFEPAATRPGHSGQETRASGTAGLGSLEVREITRIGAASSNGNTVAIEDQMIRGSQTKAGHDMALAIMRTSMNILRATLGRS